VPVSERLGHSAVVTTQDIYTHVLPHMQYQAADTMEALWKRKPAGDGTPPDQVKECAAIAYCGAP
jgi:hypothetical protein